VWVAGLSDGRPEMAWLDAEGRFKLVIQEKSQPSDGQFNGPGHCFMTVFLQPGDSIHLTADRQKFRQTVRFTGRGSATNNYLVSALKRFEWNRDSIPEELYLKETPTEFLRRVDLRRQQQFDFMAAYAEQSQQQLSPEFIRSRRLVIELQRALSLLNYVYYVKKTTKQEPILPSNFLAFMTELPLSTLQEWKTPATVQETGELFEAYIYARLLPPSGVLPSTLGTAERIFAQATADFGSTRARDQVLGGLITSQLHGPLVNDQKPVLALLPLFRAHNRDSLAALGVRKALQITEYLRRGDLAPTFTLQDASGKRVSLQDFRGKVVYLDFWYSSCAPCIAEAPAAMKLKKQFMGKDVVFVYISVDRKADDWQKALAQHPLTGPNSVHLIDPGGYKASANYGVGSFPSYWIIGRDGKIRQGSAPWPSAGKEIVVALEQALAQQP